jgi:ATP-dependent Clp protease protease subunit
MEKGKMAEETQDLLKNLQEKNLELSLYKARKIFLWSDVNDETAKAVVTRLLSLDAEDPEKEIVLYINSPGGSVHDGMAIYDAIQAIQAPVSTVCIGMAMSMGSFLLASGTPSRRFAWPHARIMLHQPLLMGTVFGSATDLDIRARETIRLREELNQLYARHTGQPVEKIAKDTDRDFFMSAQEAKDYGLIDDVITTTTPAANGKVKK